MAAPYVHNSELNKNVIENKKDEGLSCISDNAHNVKIKEAEWKLVVKKGSSGKSAEGEVIERWKNKCETFQDDNDNDEGFEKVTYHRDYGNMVVILPIVHCKEKKMRKRQ